MTETDQPETGTAPATAPAPVAVAEIESDSEPEKRITNAELFFDLVFALCVTQVSGLLHRSPDLGGAARSLIVFVPLYWAWVGTSVQASTKPNTELMAAARSEAPKDSR